MNTIQIVLRGGTHDGAEMEISDTLEDVSFPRIKSNFDSVEPITPETRKRHSWDDDALTVSYDRYRRTTAVVDGRVIYEAAQ